MVVFVKMFLVLSSKRVPQFSYDREPLEYFRTSDVFKFKKKEKNRKQS